MNIFLATNSGTIILTQEEFDYFFIYQLLNKHWLECVLQANLDGKHYISSEKICKFKKVFTRFRKS